MKRIECGLQEKLPLLAFLGGLCLALAGCGLPFGEDAIPHTVEVTQGEGEENQVPSEIQDQSVPSSSRLVTGKDVSSLVTLGEYKSLTPQPIIPTQEQMNAEILSRLAADASTLRSGDAALQEGDIAVISFVGTIGYETFEGSAAQDYILTIGSQEMETGFEEALVGMKTGETRKFPLTYPEDSLRQDLAGKTVEYRVTLQSFTRPAALTEDWLKSQGCENVEAFYDLVRQDLSEKAAQDPTQAERALWQQVMEGSEIHNYPEADLRAAASAYEKLLQLYADQAGLGLSEFLATQGLTQEACEEEAERYAQKAVAQNLVLQAILDQEGYSLDDARCQELYQTLADQLTGGDQTVLETRYGAFSVNSTVAYRRVMELINQASPS